MLKINIKKDYIPIPFINEKGEEEFELRFYKTDENIQRLMDYNDEVDEIKQAEDGEEEEMPSLADQKERDQRTIDATLGEGSFEKMYGLSESLMNVRAYYMEICIGLLNELGYQEASKSLEKYRRG